MRLEDEIAELAKAIRNGDGPTATLALDMIVHDLDCRIIAEENGNSAFPDGVGNLREVVATARAERS